MSEEKHGFTNRIIDVLGLQYTAAHAEIGINAKDGAIFATKTSSPRDAFKRNVHPEGQDAPQREATPGELPKLRALSDLLWAGWCRAVQAEAERGARLVGVKYLFSVQITNDETKSIIQRALETKRKTLVKLWPGESFGMDTEAGRALLGSPNGKRWGYLVTQRKKEIGVK